MATVEHVDSSLLSISYSGIAESNTDGIVKRTQQEWEDESDKFETPLIWEKQWTENWFQYIIDNIDTKKWCMERLSQNSNITSEIIDKYPDLSWNYQSLSMNRSITWNYVKNHSDKKWNMHFFAENPSVTMKIINENFETFKDYHYGLSKNYNITATFIKNTPEIHWNYSGVAMNPHIHLDEFIEFVNVLLPENDAFIQSNFGVFLSANVNNTLDIISKLYVNNDTYLFDHTTRTFIETNDNICNSNRYLIHNSRNSSSNYYEQPSKITQLIESICATRGDFSNLPIRGINTNISLSSADSIFHLYKWNFYKLSTNPNLTFEFVKNNLRHAWDWTAISKHSNITWDIVCENPRLPWSFNSLSVNPNITFEIIIRNPEYNWSFYWFSLNVNCSWKIVHENPNIPWNYSMLSYNTMLTSKTQYIMNRARHFFMKYIAREMMAKLWHPSSKTYEWLLDNIDDDISVI